MFIQTEPTPNPATLKFMPGVAVLGDHHPLDLRGPAEAAKIPLAKRLFAIQGVKGVFLGRDFVSVTKDGAQEWMLIKPLILGALMDHFTSDQPVIEPEALTAASVGEDGEIVRQIKEILDSMIRPAVAQDGGDVVFDSYEDGIVTLSMHGACHGCPSSTATLKSGIQNTLKYYIPEIVEVRAAE